MPEGSSGGSGGGSPGSSPSGGSGAAVGTLGVEKLTLRERLRAQMGAAEEEAGGGGVPTAGRDPNPSPARPEAGIPILEGAEEEEEPVKELRMPTFGQPTSPKTGRLTRLAASLPPERCEWVMRLYEVYREPGKGIPTDLLAEVVTAHAESMSIQEVGTLPPRCSPLLLLCLSCFRHSHSSAVASTPARWSRRSRPSG